MNIPENILKKVQLNKSKNKLKYVVWAYRSSASRIVSQLAKQNGSTLNKFTYVIFYKYS